MIDNLKQRFGAGTWLGKLCQDHWLTVACLDRIREGGLGAFLPTDFAAVTKP